MASSNFSVDKSGLIKSGFETITVPANSSKEKTITFANPYPAGTSYGVTISQSGTNGFIYASIVTGTKDRTPTGFTAVLSSTRTTETPINFMWIAFPITK